MHRDDDMFARATELGMDDAEEYNFKGVKRRSHSGREVASRLGISEPLTGEQYVGLHAAYASGWAGYW